MRRGEAPSSRLPKGIPDKLKHTSAHHQLQRMATIIKHGSGILPSGQEVRGVAYNLADIENQAGERLQGVRQEAARIIQAAKQEAEQIRRQAEQSGRQAARDAAERLLDEKVGQRMSTLTPALQQVVRNIEDAKQQWLHHWDSSAIELASAIAGRLVRGELQRRPEISVEWMREALQLAAGTGETALRLHPDDVSTLSCQIDELRALFAPISEVRIQPDATISPGGCRVETQFGSVDQQLETQLERIQQELC